MTLQPEDVLNKVFHSSCWRAVSHWQRCLVYFHTEVQTPVVKGVCFWCSTSCAMNSYCCALLLSLTSVLKCGRFSYQPRSLSLYCTPSHSSVDCPESRMECPLSSWITKSWTQSQKQASETQLTKIQPNNNSITQCHVKSFNEYLQNQRTEPNLINPQMYEK